MQNSAVVLVNSQELAPPTLGFTHVAPARMHIVASHQVKCISPIRGSRKVGGWGKQRDSRLWGHADGARMYCRLRKARNLRGKATGTAPDPTAPMAACGAFWLNLDAVAVRPGGYEISSALGRETDWFPLIHRYFPNRREIEGLGCCRARAREREGGGGRAKRGAFQTGNRLVPI